jgi:hypothetical protein
MLDPATIVNNIVGFNPSYTVNVGEIFIENKTYECANQKAIDEGFPVTVDQCMSRFFTTPSDANKLKPDAVDTTQTEPTNTQLNEAYKQTLMCDAIGASLGADYLGCVLSEPKLPFSCGCPKIGSKFPKLLNFAFKNSTFWKTDLRTPLYRQALLSLMNCVKVQINVAGKFAVNAGDVIYINDPKLPGFQSRDGKLNGRWLVLSVSHKIFKDRHHEMILTLSAFGNAIANSTFLNTKVSDLSVINEVQR